MKLENNNSSVDTKSTDSNNRNENLENSESSSNTNETTSNSTNKKDATTSILEESVYPMYLPSGTYLSDEESVSKDDGNRVILTFAA